MLLTSLYIILSVSLLCQCAGTIMFICSPNNLDEIPLINAAFIAILLMGGLIGTLVSATIIICID